MKKIEEKINKITNRKNCAQDVVDRETELDDRIKVAKYHWLEILSENKLNLLSNNFQKES